MAGNSSSSYGTSWADQWDNGPDPVPAHTKTNGSSSNNKTNYGKKVGDGFGKTKAVASVGAKKVKAGASVGFQWIKQKYHKTTQKN